MPPSLPVGFAKRLNFSNHQKNIRRIHLNKPRSNARRVEKATFTAILGRTSAYTGKEISYNCMFTASKLDLPLMTRTASRAQLKIFRVRLICLKNRVAGWREKQRPGCHSENFETHLVTALHKVPLV